MGGSTCRPSGGASKLFLFDRSTGGGKGGWEKKGEKELRRERLPALAAGGIGPVLLLHLHCALMGRRGKGKGGKWKEGGKKKLKAFSPQRNAMLILLSVPVFWRSSEGTGGKGKEKRLVPTISCWQDFRPFLSANKQHPREFKSNGKKDGGEKKTLGNSVA